MTTDRFFASKPGGRRAPLAVALALSLGIGALLAARAATGATTSAGLWGIYDQSGINVAPLVATQGRDFALFTQEVKLLPAATGFPTSTAQTAKAEGALYVLGINPYQMVNGVKSCVPGGDAAVAAGTYDTQLQAWKAALDTWGGNYMLIWYQEPVVTSSAQPNCGTASDFVSAFDHVASIFGAGRMVWDMDAADYRSGVAASYQPNDYAIRAVDGYGTPTKSPSSVFGAFFTFPSTKPTLIRSVGMHSTTASTDAQSAAWLSTASSYFIQHGVYGVAWDMDAFMGPLSQQAFVTASQQPYWGGTSASPSPTLTTPSPSPTLPSPAPSAPLPSPSPTLPSPSPSKSLPPGWAPGTPVTCSGSVQSNNSLSLTCSP